MGPLSGIAQKGARLSCDHQGQSQAGTASTRVKVAGAAALLTPMSVSVSGCTLTTPPGAPIPCVTVIFATGAARVKSEGRPLLLERSRGQAVGPLPVQGTGSVSGVQGRAKAQ